jgi:hypothetical protein
VTEYGVLPGLWPIQGDGVLARQGDLVLLIHPAGGSFTDRLLELLAEAARTGASGLHFTDRVSAEFDADATAAHTAAGPGPAVVAFGPAGDGTAVAVYGAGWAEITTAHGAQRLTAGEPYGRLRCVLPSTLISVRAGVQAVASDAETDPYLRLADGVVRAVALLYAPAEIAAGQQAPAPPAGLPIPAPPAPVPAVPEPVPGQVQQAAPEPYPDQAEEPEPEYHATRIEPAVATPPGPAAPPLPPDPYAAPPPDPGPSGGLPDDAPPPDFIPVPAFADQAGGEMPQRDPLPPDTEASEANDLGLTEMPSEMPSAMVEGVYCANGHFNDPETDYCAVCGMGMSQPPQMRQKGDRPPLGVLILGDGSVCQLDADYVIGREPTLDSAVAEGRARPLRLMDASGVVSRIHARVELDGWQVFITDLHSANGTQVLLPGERNPTNLEPGVRTPLMAGTQIRLGGEYGLQYDSHRQR